MELLLTVFTLLAAIYALIPRERRLDLQLRLGGADWVAIGIGFVLVFYFEFYEFFETLGFTPAGFVWPHGITPKNSVYLVILAVVLFLVLHVRFAGLSRRKIPKFQELTEELFWEAHFGELLTLLQRHMRDLFKIYHGDFILSRLRRRLSPSLEKELFSLTQGETRHDFRNTFFQFSKRVIHRAANLLPTYERQSEAAREIIRMLLLSPRFVRALATTRPYLALEVIRYGPRSFERLDFLDLYMKELMQDSSSIFYTEIARNQNLSASNRYCIPESNRLIHFFLADANVAETLRIYKPIGDFVLQELDQAARDPNADPNNMAMGDFAEAGAWKSPLFVTIRFFDIMVMEALYQGIQWHMWLYYFPPIVKKIVRNYALSDPLADPEAEFPVRYNFLLYEIISAHRDWILAVKDVPADQPNVILHSTRVDHENNNIPKSAILSLSECMRSIVEAGNIGARFRRYLIGIVLELYFKLRKTVGYEPYATVLLQALAQGGFFRRRDSNSYSTFLVKAFEEQKMEYLIKHSHEHVSELEGALRTSAES